MGLTTRISSLNNAMNWRYAVGEIALIVVGVTIALAGTAWYENLQLRQSELGMLRQLEDALQSDLMELSSAYEAQKLISSNIQALIRHLDSDVPFSEEFVPLFSSIRRWHGIDSNSAPYQALKSQGFDLISDDSIRLKLIEYYEVRWPPLQNTYLNDREFVRANVVPYFLTHFRHEADYRYVPIEFENLKKDLQFRNICMTKISRIQRFTIPSYESSIEVIEELTRLIAAEIE